MLDVIWLIPAFPLVGFLLDPAVRPPSRRAAQRLPRLARWCSPRSWSPVGAYFDLLSMDAARPLPRRDAVLVGARSALQIDMAFLADPLSITMCLFVTGIGFLIHLFAIGYMHGDPKFSKFFLYLNLFVLSMTLLVLGENLLVTFLGWEGVGTCSYLLISFWHTNASRPPRPARRRSSPTASVTGASCWRCSSASRPSARSATTPSTAPPKPARSPRRPPPASPLLLFVGAVGKSAQLPLYVWLPDAMEGPTPVSALIHAATMVTAGVFLMARMNPMLAAAAPEASTIIAVGRRDHGAVRRHDRRRPDRHQEGAGLLDGQPARLHVPGRRVGRLRRRDLPHGHPRVLQGAAVPRFRLGDPRHARRAGHAQDGRAPQAHADHGRHVHHRLAGDRRRARRSPGFWSKDEILLFTLAKGGRGVRSVRDRPRHGGAHRVLHDAPGDHGVLRRGEVGEPRQRRRGHPRASKNSTHGAHGEFKPHESPPIMLFPLVVLAGLAIVGGMHPAARRSASSPTNWQHKLEHWLHPVVEAGEAQITDTVAYDNKGLLALLAIAVRTGRDRRRDRGRTPGSWPGRSNRRSWPMATSTTRRSAPSWAVPAARRSRRSPGSTRTSSTVRSTARPRSSAEPADRSARARPATCATTPASSAIGVVLLLAWFVIGRGVL